MITECNVHPSTMLNRTNTGKKQTVNLKYSLLAFIIQIIHK
jgi:hypothetical protein